MTPIADWTRIEGSDDAVPSWERLQDGRRRAFCQRHESDTLPGRSYFLWRTYEPNGAQRDHGDAETWDEMARQVAYDLGRDDEVTGPQQGKV